MRGRSVRGLLGAAALALAASPAAALDAAQIDAGARQAARGLKPIVKKLASNRLAGRDNDSPGSLLAQKLLVKRLAKIAEPLLPGPEPFLQPFLRDGDAGDNVLAVIPGRELPDEYVLVGGHYDHLAPGECGPGPKPKDTICNGATDNAAGTAAVLAIAKAIAKGPEPPRRSVLIALWDAEEDGLEGSEYYVQEDPVVPLAQIVAYVNLDLLGATLIPSLARNTFAIGSESGGAALAGIVEDAGASQDLDLTPLRYVFGQGRSDYAPFGAAGVPIVFYGDGSSGCYHTAGDESKRVDWRKLGQQSAMAYRTVVELAEAPLPPPFTAPAALPGYADAVALQGLLDLAIPADLPLFSEAAQAEIQGVADLLGPIVDAGEGAFDEGATVLAAAGLLISHLEALPCGAF